MLLSTNELMLMLLARLLPSTVATWLMEPINMMFKLVANSPQPNVDIHALLQPIWFSNQQLTETRRHVLISTNVPLISYLPRKRTCQENSTCANKNHVVGGPADDSPINDGYSCECNAGYTAKMSDGSVATNADLRNGAICFDDECLMCVGGDACGVEEGSFYRCGAYLNNVCNNIDDSLECLYHNRF